jgi:ubiquinone/menaquinone biosynthesis C-methylase UbiE
MNKAEQLREVLTEGCAIRLVEDDIYSALREDQQRHFYDRRATAYDAIVGTRIYNRIMWGTSPLDYVAFAREAIRSHAGERMLDAGCGSLLFTARLYTASDRQIIAFDQSLRMLQRARARLIALSGSVPEHILLLQADLGSLVFHPKQFRTILCMNVLHQFTDAAELIRKIKVLLDDAGQLYLTSLVSTGRYVGDWWLRTLYKSGEFVRPRSSNELNKLLANSASQDITCRLKGNMAFAIYDRG